MSTVRRRSINPAPSEFDWILRDAKEHYAADMDWRDFCRRYAEIPRFLPCDAEKVLAFLTSPERREIIALQRRLAIRQMNRTRKERRVFLTSGRDRVG